MSFFSSFFKEKKSNEQVPDLNLNIPNGWNALTTVQVEQVSRVLIDTARDYTASGIWDKNGMLVKCFFIITDLEILSGPHCFDEEDTDTSTVNTALTYIEMSASDMSHFYFLCQYKDKAKRKRFQTFKGEERPICITLYEIAQMAVGHYILNKKNEPEEKPGPLGWILKPSDLTNFPYPELTLEDTPTHFRGSNFIVPEGSHSGNNKRTKQQNNKTTRMVTLAGPAPLMDGMSWRQYRICSDYMQSLQKFENHLLTIQKNSAAYGTDRINRQRELVDEVRAQFLANLFCRSIRHIDPETGQPKDGYYYVSSQCMDNSYLFRNFPEEKYQAILLWWQGMMHYLSRQYPKVFRTEKKIGKADPLNDPLKLYTRSTTTMIKYSGMSEEEVNRTSYSIVLQQMNDMADENDRMEEMRKKH